MAERLSSGNVLLVGDAAGLAEGLFGEGIHHAVRSAHLAVETVMGFLAGRNALSEYDRLLRPMLRDLAFARATASLFYRLPHSAAFKMSRSRFASHFFGGLVTGNVSPGRCFFYTAGLAPMWLLEPAGPPCTMASALQVP